MPGSCPEDLSNARISADDFLESALSTADPFLQALAWDLKARVSMAESNFCGRPEIYRAGPRDYRKVRDSGRGLAGLCHGVGVVWLRKGTNGCGGVSGSFRAVHTENCEFF